MYRLIVAVVLILSACHTPNVSQEWQTLKTHVQENGPGCYLHWGEQTQQYSSRLLPVCEELRKPSQRVYSFVMSAEQAAELLASGYFGHPPPFRELRGYYVRSSYLAADSIGISETVLDDGAERSLIQHELCHSREFEGDPICDPHKHDPPDVSGTSQALTQGDGTTVYVTGEVDGELVTVPVQVEEP